MRKHRHIALAVIPVLVAGCSHSELDPGTADYDELTPIALGGHIDQEYTTRAGQDGFADGDKIGTFIVDYVDGNPGELLLEGNRADNLYYTYNEAGNRWVPSYDVYYKDSRTPVDIYGYYPSGKPE